MFGIAPSELLIVALVAIVLVGPKDLPRVLRVVGQWVGRGQALVRQFRGTVDEFIRETERHEMEQKWPAENERIMREHVQPTIPAVGAEVAPAISLPGEAPVPAKATDPPRQAFASSDDATLTLH